MKKTYVLDPEENELLKSFANNEFISAPNLKSQIRKYIKYAKAFVTIISELISEYPNEI